ncbi:hypothetical protein JMJ35_002071 [Cladonia borealis]|uniref:Cyanovirin-N domain-containing protein n=1 Tax=Cladonia borealis TaxID=184061 RepID=A0AA39R6X1_9LECA|nr:hypothetical protein JMJ35_002071 [Cladonia borealis]
MAFLRQLIRLSLGATLPILAASAALPAEISEKVWMAGPPFPGGGGWQNTEDGLLAFTGNSAFPIPANALDIPWCMHDGMDNVDITLNYGVLIPNDSEYDKSCGEGFLDNLRGRCGVISGWGCGYTGAENTTAALSFSTVNTCTEWDVTQALLAASYGKLNIPCNWASPSSYEGGDLPPTEVEGGLK